MNSIPERQTIVFVVRLWQEATADPERSQWRGQIEHVPTGDKSYFQLSNSMLKLFLGDLPASVDTPTTGPAKLEK